MKLQITALTLALASLPSFAIQTPSSEAPQLAARMAASDSSPVQTGVGRDAQPTYGDLDNRQETLTSSVVTRGQVRADLNAAIARGEHVAHGNLEPKESEPTVSPLTRAEVRAGLLAAAARGERGSSGDSSRW